MKVSVLTASLPQRADMLAEAKASVLAQVCADIEVEHLIAIDHDREGAGALLNRCLAMAGGDYVMVLDDDDLLMPHHVKTVVAAALLGDSEVTYTLPEVVGASFSNYHAPFDPARLARTNIVSHNALVSAEWVRKIDGWRNLRPFDWDLFQRLESAGAEFQQVREVTWVYRFHGANWSRGELEGGAEV